MGLKHHSPDEFFIRSLMEKAEAEAKPEVIKWLNSLLINPRPGEIWEHNNGEPYLLKEYRGGQESRWISLNPVYDDFPVSEEGYGDEDGHPVRLLWSMHPFEDVYSSPDINDIKLRRTKIAAFRKRSLQDPTQAFYEYGLHKKNDFKEWSEDIDDLIDAWHNDLEDNEDIHKYIGMSWEEYRKWSELPWLDFVDWYLGKSPDE